MQADRAAAGLVDASALMRVRSIELRAKLVMEGVQRGLHRSPFHGFSVEFTEYRPYTPGDDVRFVDWRLLARTDRNYVRKYEDETNLRCHLVLDVSRSMAYGSLGHTKGQYAATLAATLATFLCGQGDAVGLLCFSDRITDHLPARNRPGHLRRLYAALERPPHGAATALERPLLEALDTIRRRGLVVLLSDLLAPIGEMERRLGAMAAAGHEVLVLQVLDPVERRLSLEGPAMLRDLESGRTMLVDPASARGAYTRAFDAHLEAIRVACQRWGIDHHPLSTDEPLDQALLRIIDRRTRRVRRR